MESWHRHAHSNRPRSAGPKTDGGGQGPELHCLDFARIGEVRSWFPQTDSGRLESFGEAADDLRLRLRPRIVLRDLRIVVE